MKQNMKSLPTFGATRSAAAILISATLALSGCGGALDKLAGSPPAPAGAKDFPIPNVENDGELINGIRVNTNGKAVASESVRIIDRVVLNSILVNAIGELVQSSAYLPTLTTVTSTLKLDCTSLGSWVFDRKERAKIALATATSNTVDIVTNRNLAVPFSAPSAGDSFTFTFKSCYLGQGNGTPNFMNGTAKVDIQRYSSATDAIYKVAMTSLRQSDYPSYFGTRSASYTLTTGVSNNTITDYVDGTTKAASLTLTNSSPAAGSQIKVPSRNVTVSAATIDSSLDTFKNEPIKLTFTNYSLFFDNQSLTGLPAHSVQQLAFIFTNGRRGFLNLSSKDGLVTFFGSGAGEYLEIQSPADSFVLPR
jgi:hypothetical protein